MVKHDIRDKFLLAARLRKQAADAMADLMAEMGKLGGSVKSSKKKQAATLNGRLGGRPTRKKTP